MPEGDSIRLDAARLASLEGQTVVSLAGSHRAVRGEGRRIRNRRVTGVRAVGKHLLIDFDNDWTLRCHLGMTGRWHIYKPNERWRQSPGKARIVLETETATAVCFASPTVQLAPTALVEKAIGHLGPDLSDNEVDTAEIVRRARQASAPTAADLLLDQDVMAGAGNVIKSEVLFLEGVDPHTPMDEMDNDTIAGVANRAGGLLRANAVPRPRTTTGASGRDQRMWVYGRAGQPCRRCGTTIASDTHGSLDRVTYWCPGCQGPRA